MKKKLLSFIFAICLIIPAMFMLSACTKEDEKYFEVKYNLNGGINSEQNITTIKEDEDFILSEPTREGFVFDGWYESKTFDGNAVIQIDDIETNVELFAKWSLPQNTNNEYIISNVDTLIYLKDNKDLWDKNFSLSNSIDLGGILWEGIGDSYYQDSMYNKGFSGTFKGNGYTISNFKLEIKSYSPFVMEHYLNNRCGFFNYIDGGKVSGLNLFNVNIKGNYQFGRFNDFWEGVVIIGCLAGYCDGIVENCDVIASEIDLNIYSDIYNNFSIGGLIGGATVEGNSIKNCKAYCDINIDIALPGGYSTSNMNCAGLIGGTNSSDGTISNCCFVGDIVCNQYSASNNTEMHVAGLVAKSWSIMFENCFAISNISVVANSYSETYVGGINANGSSENSDRLNNCFSKMMVDYRGAEEILYNLQIEEEINDYSSNYYVDDDSLFIINGVVYKSEIEELTSYTTIKNNLKTIWEESGWNWHEYPY